MEIATLAPGPLLQYIGGAFLTGLLVGVLTNKLLNRRAIFSHYTVHNRIATTTDDPVYGTVEVFWGGQKVLHQLYLSTITLTNNSTKDFENVTALVFTRNTDLLNEKASLEDTTHILHYTDEYKRDIHVEPGQAPSDEQERTYRRRREYRIPTMNRGQVATFEFLNAAHSTDEPKIFLEVVHKGVKDKITVPPEKTFGVPRHVAAWTGLFIGIALIAALIAYVDNVALATIVAFVYGLFALYPGAFVLRAWWWLQELWAG